MFVKKILPGVCFILWMVVQSPYSYGVNSAQQEYEQEAKRLFIEVEKIVRMPLQEQKIKVAHLYQDIFMPVENRECAFAFLPRPDLGDYQKLSPSDMAEQILNNQNLGVCSLKELAYVKCKGLLTSHLENVRPLVKKDLDSNELLTVRRGVHSVGELKLKEFYEEILNIFRRSKNDELINQSAYVLRDLNNPKVIPFLIRKHSLNPMEYFEIIRNLSRDRIPDAHIIELLSSDDDQIRWKAVYTLEESQGESLIPIFNKIAKDTSAQVRREAVYLGVNLLAQGHQQVYSELKTFLSDADKEVRLRAAIGFAGRKDKTGAPALLELMNDESLNSWDYSNMMQAINTLTGSYFGYNLSSAPTVLENRQAMEHFAQWIKENVQQ